MSISHFPFCDYFLWLCSKEWEFYFKRFRTIKKFEGPNILSLGNFLQIVFQSCNSLPLSPMWWVISTPLTTIWQYPFKCCHTSCFGNTFRFIFRVGGWKGLGGWGVTKYIYVVLIFSVSLLSGNHQRKLVTVFLDYILLNTFNCRESNRRELKMSVIFLRTQKVVHINSNLHELNFYLFVCWLL